MNLFCNVSRETFEKPGTCLQALGFCIILTIWCTNAGDNPKPFMGASCSPVIHDPSIILADGNNHIRRTGYYRDPAVHSKGDNGKNIESRI